MNSQIIVIVQVLIVGTFILWIFSRKGSTPKPTILNLSENNTKQNQMYPAGSKYGVKKFDHPLIIEEVPKQPKNLNVIFMWNGHSWDAYEVFGLPAGSSVERVRERYAELLSKSDDGQRLFLAAAKSAIENKSV